MDNRFTLRWARSLLILGGGIIIAFFLITGFPSSIIIDRAFVGIYLLAMLIYFNDKNITGVLGILIGASLIDDFLWHIHHKSWYFEITTLFICSLLCLKFWYDRWSKIMFAVGIAVIVVQFYLHSIEYQTTVRLSWYVIIGTLQILIRHYILYRTAWSRRWMSNVYFINLDWQIYETTRVICVLCILTLGEYVARHALHIQSTFIYSAYPYVIYTVNCAYLFYIYQHLTQDKAKLKA
jgi:hypothetical protein